MSAAADARTLVVADRLRLPEPRAPVHRAHRVRRGRARAAAAAPARRRGARAHRGAARAVRARRQGADRTRSCSRADRSAASRSAPRSSPVRPVLALDEPTFGQDRARADELLGAAARAQRRGHDDPRRHARHAAGHRVRRPHDRDGRRPRRRARARPPRCSPTTSSSSAPAFGRRRCGARCGAWRGIPNSPASRASPTCPAAPSMTATGPVLAAQAPPLGFDPYADRVSARRRSASCTRSTRSRSSRAPLPAMLLLVFVRDAATPLAFLAAQLRDPARRGELHAAPGRASCWSPFRSVAAGDRLRLRAVDRPVEGRPERRRAGRSDRGRCTAARSQSDSPPVCASRRSSRSR